MSNSRIGAVRKEDFSQLRADVHIRWKRGLDTAAIARELHIRECDVERALHQILDARYAVNTVLGAG